MDELDAIVSEHGALRRLAAAMARLLGPRRGIGHEDRVPLDRTAMRAALAEFSGALAGHEAKEEALVAALARGVPELSPALERCHETLEGLLSLLKAITDSCDGEHVHALRAVAWRLEDELESHLGYEEKVLFPLLRGRAPR